MPKGGARAGSGGKRKGAGRPKGVPNKAAAERERAVRESGQTPLDVMIETMRYFRGLGAKYQLNGDDPNEDKQTEYLRAACTIAKDAAPYVHSKMSAVDQVGGPRDLSKLTDAELDDLERISRKIAGAFGNTSGEDPS